MFSPIICLKTTFIFRADIILFKICTSMKSMGVGSHLNYQKAFLYPLFDLVSQIEYLIFYLKFSNLHINLNHRAKCFQS